MASETLTTIQPAGLTIYAVVWYQGTYFNWTTQALESPAAGTYANAALAASEQARGVNSAYETAAVNFATLWNYLAARQFDVIWYLQAGGTPNPTTDQELAIEPLTVQMGVRGDGNLPPVVDVQVTPGFRKDQVPQVASWWITVTANGQPVNLYTLADSPAVGCSVVIREEAAGADEFTVTVSAPDSTYGRLYVTKSTPGFTAERTYIGRIDIGSGTILADCGLLAAG